ncbi:MAG TPA: hypothetical protein VKV74_08160 [Bryobacteraceae bacterium]|nr:hypothetical protein [Bryobacteraceae bacterium]
MKTTLLTATLAAFGLASVNAQTLDHSGNGLLNGSFRFRQLAVVNIDQNGNPTEMAGAYGVITFDGNGNYSVTGTYVDNTVSNGSPQALSVTSTYVIGSNGLGYISNPLVPTDSGSRIYGAVAQGVFVGSATESQQVNDLLIAIPAGAPPTNSSFNTPYQVGVLDFPGGTSAAIKNALFKLSPNGSGGFASITLNGQASNNSATFVTQTVTGATYNFQSDGSATLNFPLPSGVTAGNALVGGTRTAFVSADGNFILGYNPTGYDMFVGVKALASAIPNNVPPNGLFFNAALEDVPAGNGVDNFYGSIHSFGDTNGDAIVHQRVGSIFFYPYDFGVDDQIELNPDGTSTYSGCTAVLCADFNGYAYGFGDTGQAYVAIGTGGFFSVSLGLLSPSTPGPSTSSVYLNPIGIVNAASGAPVTASLAPGETITLYGKNLATVTMNGPNGPAPNNLGGTQVIINGIAAPLYYVSSGQVNAVIPWELSAASLATIQVLNNGTPSNSVTMYMADSNPGVFTQNETGIGFGAATHADYSLITPSNPAQPGETILVFLTGLGTVTPTVSDGALGSTDPNNLNKADLWTTNTLGAYFNDYVNGNSAQGTIQYAGLAPGLLGYQLNVTIPSGVGSPNSGASGGVYLELVTDQADINQVQIPVGAASAASLRPHARSAGLQRRPHPGSLKRLGGAQPSRRGTLE